MPELGVLTNKTELDGLFCCLVVVVLKRRCTPPFSFLSNRTKGAYPIIVLIQRNTKTLQMNKFILKCLPWSLPKSSARDSSVGKHPPISRPKARVSLHSPTDTGRRQYLPGHRLGLTLPETSSQSHYYFLPCKERQTLPPYLRFLREARCSRKVTTRI